MRQKNHPPQKAGNYSATAKDPRKPSGNQRLKTPNQPRQHHVLILAVLIFIVIGITFTAHYPVLTARALSFDDDQYLTDNQLVKNPSWTSTGRFLTEILKPSTVAGYYQPLAMISLMLDYGMGGRGDNLRLFHQTSLILHLSNTILIIILLYLLFGNYWVAAAVGLLFGVHPMTVEPIAWLGERKTLLAAFFSLWALIFYLGYLRKSNRKFWWTALIAYAAALLSKPTSTPLPLLMLLLDYWPLARFSKKTVLEKIPFLILGMIAAIITYLSQKNTSGATVYPGLQFLLVPGYNIMFYLFKFIWPIHLSSFYPFPEPFTLANPVVAAMVGGTCLLIVILLVSWRWTKAFLIGWLFFFIALIPTMGGIRFNDVIASDKYAYLPLIGILIVLGWLLNRFWDQNRTSTRVDYRTRTHAIPRHAGLILLVLILTVAETAVARDYLAKWQDSGVLYRYMLKLAPNSASLHFGYGKRLYDNGRFDPAITQFNETIRLDPNFTLAYNNIGAILMQRKDWDHAAAYFTKAIQTNPRMDQAYGNLGIILFYQGKRDQAVAMLHKAVELEPENVDNSYNLASSLFQMGRLDEAITYFANTTRLDPHHAAAYFYWGLALARRGNPDLAAVQFEECIRINPDNANAHKFLGEVLYQLGRYDEASTELETALRINPKFTDIPQFLQAIRQREGRP